MKVVGCCKYSDNIIVNLEESTEEQPESIIAPLPANNEEELIAQIRSRYDSGFSTISSFDIADQPWGLFAKQPSAADLTNGD